MRSSLFGIAAFAFIAITQVVASPVANADSVELVEKRQTEDVDAILADLIVSVKATDATYTSTTCASSCSSTKIKSWCSEIAGHCHTAIDKCKALPSGHQFPDKDKCAGLVIDLLTEINTTLKFLLSKAGLLGLLTGLLSLISVLIAALNELLAVLATCVVDGLLAAILALLSSIVGCLICSLLVL